MARIPDTQQMRWRVVAAKAVGTSHRRVGQRCDDHFGCLTLSNAVQILAVADGAGSATRGAEGARIAVTAVLDAAQQTFLDGQQPESEQAWTDLVHRVVVAARLAVETATAQSLTTIPGELLENMETQPLLLAAPLREYATTLLLAILAPERLALLQLGDGMIVAQAGNGVCWCPVPPSNDREYVNDTHFLTDLDYRNHVHTALLKVGDVHGVALLTDGLQVLASTMTSQQPYPPFFSPLFAFAAKPTASDADLEAFLNSDRVCQRTDDDKTLVLAVRI